jgi:hypothetical protein
VATDVDGNVGTSPGVSVTVANAAPATTLEKPTLLRVKPGDPANSYRVQKLQGTAGIS